MAIFAHGSEIHMGNEDGPPETFSKLPVPGDIEFTPPQPERIDVTNHDSAAREYLQGLGGEGEVTFDVHFDAGEPLHIALRDKHGVATTTTFQIHFPDVEGTIAQFEATVSNTFSLPVGDAQVMSCTLAISGAVSWP
jgi:hypothetical protein